MVNTTKREIFSKLRAYEIQSYLGHTAFMQTTSKGYKLSQKDAWEEAMKCCDIGMRALRQLMELKKERYLLLNEHPNYQYYYDELAALSNKYSKYN